MTKENYMFKELEKIRQYCIGGLSPLGYEELDKGLFMEGYKRALENVKAQIERQQDRIVQEGMDSYKEMV
jgi:hypothetical protein